MSIVFIPFSAEQCKPEQVDWEWLCRRCPSCKRGKVIGHGRRWRQAHGPQSHRIRIRRGRCVGCGRTITVLPAWCVARSPYVVAVRQDAMQRCMRGEAFDVAVPVCVDPDRLVDASTVRRWWVRILSLPWLLAMPTMVAWDWPAMRLILSPEPVPS